MADPFEAEFLGHFPVSALGPTTRLRAMDLSREAARTSGTYERWDGALPVSEPCVCGGVITADSGAVHHVLTAVRAHQGTTEHALWQRRVDW